jgi:PPOX class probable F420-dependent enzyme
MKDPRSKMTATPENAMTPAERDAFLSNVLLTRVSTNRPDGWPHTAPAWFLWENGTFLHSFGPGRQHIRNMKRDPRITECIDIDERLFEGLAGRAAATVCFGEAEILNDPEEQRALMERILLKYLGPADAAKYLEPSLAEIPQGRVQVRVRPRRWITWDYAKVH